MALRVPKTSGFALQHAVADQSIGLGRGSAKRVTERMDRAINMMF